MALGNGRCSATYPDTEILLNCDYQTLFDGVRRNRHAW
jgi:hypothetical protein